MLADKELLQFAKISHSEIFKRLKTSLAGLDPHQIPSLRQKYGTNQLTYYHRKSLGRQLLAAFVTPFTVVLFVLAVVSFVTDYWLAAPGDKTLLETSIILVMVLISGAMTLIQSVKSDQAAEKLQSLVSTTTQVIRDQKLETIATDELVVGDLVKLAAGAMVPADLRIIQAKDLIVSQAALTGESYPVEKKAHLTAESFGQVTDLTNLTFMGSNVLSGTALGVVIATGTNTRFGKVTQSLANKQAVQTNFDVGISQTSWLLIRFMAIMVPIVCVLNGLTKGDWMQALLFGISLAVGLTPEMLPVIVTTNLVRGALEMSRNGTVVKNIHAIQNFGAMDILCTDKTGTLTQDQIVLVAYNDLQQQSSLEVLRVAYLNSQFQTGLNNLMDTAIIETAHQQLQIDKRDIQKIDELPFDFTRRRMSTIVQTSLNQVAMVTKGAVEEMLSVSTKAEIDGQEVSLTPPLRTKLAQQAQQLNQQGLRVLAISRKFNPQPQNGTAFNVQDEQQMTLVGYLAFLDPPKRTSAQAIQALKDHGTAVKIITGDSQLVTQSVCQQIGFDVQQVLTGQALSQLTPQQWAKAVETTNVFVKVSPEQKAQIVQTLRQNEHVVGFLGDGINDAPAMKKADVGICVDTAVDIAKEAASIILLQKDLLILEQGVVIGRKTFGNIMKYIKATCSSNFGNMLSVLFASAFLPFLPMQPLQLLFLNFTYDLSCLSLPWDRMDSEYLKVPRKWRADSIGRFMIWFGPTSSLFDLTTYLALYFWLCPQVLGQSFAQTNGPSRQYFIQLFNSGWFVESLWTQTFVLHALRTSKIPFVQSRASKIMIFVTTGAVILGSLLPWTALGRGLDLVRLPVNFWLLLGVTIVGYMLLVTVAKKWYVRRFGELL
ncbi:magnesium-translocating P-type ATPase [Bombilactobacillus folatiphilus]|uniref:Magnesium-transporting ATPase, P-type 1 n=1 Tax=Bombilactobacillus folatiphilus TaxID=2923362 RepID=A0ABY4P906_9LACO|nr:magnesium-translocating P-type ATPase [Bombilactobacillus folatiphilus]UQS82064.1 magnesium-translocating P-type ATPase [Bombilactobacillus folatiphilus]